MNSEGKIEEVEDIFYGDQLRSAEDTGGLLPHVKEIIEEINAMIIWKKGEKGEIPCPVEGMMEGYDRASEEVENIKGELDDYLR